MSTYIKPENRKTILFVGDDLRYPSGVGVMSRAIVYRTAEYFNWIQIGVLTRHKDPLLTTINISEDVNNEMGYKDSNVIIIPDVVGPDGYGSMETFRAVLQNFKIDALMIFTDPRYYNWVWEHEGEIHKNCPIIYLNIWDNLPYPLWNQTFYQSCDGLFAISKQTYNINRQLLKNELDEHVIKYVPHGIETDFYHPISEDNPDLIKFKRDLLSEIDYDFILFYNARNMGRKNIINLMFGWREFINSLPNEKKTRCLLLMHTDPVDNSGTDLNTVYRDNFDKTQCLIKIVNTKMPFEQLNLMYNCCDGVILPSHSEGWGLSVTESLLTGKMFIATVTGGMQDQMRFENSKGKWINFSEEFPSNQNKKYEKHGSWCIPMFPSAVLCGGSPLTPYIYEDVVNPQDIASAITTLYNIPKSERIERGMSGLEWAKGDEAGFTAEYMAQRVTEGIKEVLKNYNKPADYDIINIGDREDNQINYSIVWKK